MFEQKGKQMFLLTLEGKELTRAMCCKFLAVRQVHICSETARTLV